MSVSALIAWREQLNLPDEAFANLSRKLIKKFYSRLLAEHPSDVLLHLDERRYATFALFCHYRCQLITDNLADLLIQLIHKIKTSAEKFVNKKIISEVKRVNGKFDILYLLAKISGLLASLRG